MKAKLKLPPLPSSSPSPVHCLSTRAKETELWKKLIIFKQETKKYNNPTSFSSQESRIPI
jgi:hypothetical protein